MGRKCVFFDRDGVANVAPPPEEYYVLSPERLFIQPAFLEALGVVEEKGWVAVLVTNQKSVHRGLITMEGVDAVHDHLRAVVHEHGRQLLDIYTCPHGDGHPDRKPNPGMLLRAAADHDLDLSSAWMVGDSERDIQAGQAAGCAVNVLVVPGDEPTAAEVHLQSMKELPDYLRTHL